MIKSPNRIDFTPYSKDLTPQSGTIPFKMEFTNECVKSSISLFSRIWQNWLKKSFKISQSNLAFNNRYRLETLRHFSTQKWLKTVFVCESLLLMVERHSLHFDHFQLNRN